MCPVEQQALGMNSNNSSTNKTSEPRAKARNGGTKKKKEKKKKRHDGPEFRGNIMERKTATASTLRKAFLEKEERKTDKREINEVAERYLG